MSSLDGFGDDAVSILPGLVGIVPVLRGQEEDSYSNCCGDSDRLDSWCASCACCDKMLFYVYHIHTDIRFLHCTAVCVAYKYGLSFQAHESGPKKPSFIYRKWKQHQMINRGTSIAQTLIPVRAQILQIYIPKEIQV